MEELRNDEKKKGWKKEILFPVLLSLFYGIAFIFADFYNMPVAGMKDFVILALQWDVIVLATYGLLLLLSLNRYVFAVTFPLLTLACTVLTYFKYTVKVSLTASVWDLVLVNDFQTSMEVVSWALVVLVILSIALSLAVVYVRFRYIRYYHPVFWLIVALALVGFTNSYYPIQRPVSYRMPYNIYYSFRDYQGIKRTISEHRPPFSRKIKSDDDSVTVVFILGESLRSKNLPANGYGRNTTPRLLKEHNVVWLPNIHSPYGYTHTSVPYLLTRADRLHPERAYEERSFIDLFKAAGFKTSWIGNQESDPTFLYFMEEADTLTFVNGGKTVYSLDQWLDGNLLPPFRQQLDRDGGKKLFILHTIGSHWYYRSHYPDAFACWKPEIHSKIVSSNSHEQMVNSYDNTILYSDSIWEEIINSVRNNDAIVVYLSDHSECMGENGEYTHGGTEKEALHYPACWVWYSDRYAQKHGDKVRALRENSRRRYDSSFLFHSLLDAADLETPYLKRKFSIFSH